MSGPIQVIPGLSVWRCTEALTRRSGAAVFQTFGNPDGRCVEIISSRNQMLFDRRLARTLALAILDICGPDEELPSDIAQADTVEVTFDHHGVPIGFIPFVPPPPTEEEKRAFAATLCAVDESNLDATIEQHDTDDRSEANCKPRFPDHPFFKTN